jgi:ComF family protein
MDNLRKIWGLALDIFFPPICLNCRKYLEKEEKPNLICDSCRKSIEINKILFRPSPGFLLAAASSYENEALKNLIHYFKYEKFMAAGKPLEEILIEYLKNIFIGLDLSNSVIIPIPLHPKRFHSRGFNQSEILANIISKHFNIPLETDILKRIKNTKPQIKTKNHKEREENLKGSFEISADGKNILKNKNIILVDDVYTSGATMNAAIKAIRRENKNRIIGVVVAKT